MKKAGQTKNRTIRKNIFACLLMAAIIIAGFIGGTAVNAASSKSVTKVAVSVGKKTVTKKTYEMQKGQKKTLKVTATPKSAVKSVSYRSQTPAVASVSKNGRVTAKQTGTTKITVTVTDKNNKKKSAWVRIRVKEASSSGTESGQKKVLVAYFSATNTTEKVAGYIADSLNADVYEILPAVPYTAADLDYGNDNSRTSIEMNDPNSRPEISGSVSNMDQYDIVFIGYPIWWGESPRIVSTFMESYDFSGKTVIPFCTSGSSPIGSSAANLQKLAPNAQWLSGRRFSGSASRESVVSWVNGLNLETTIK